jgi:hypothetical protein
MNDGGLEERYEYVLTVTQRRTWPELDDHYIGTEEPGADERGYVKRAVLKDRMQYVYEQRFDDLDVSELAIFLNLPKQDATR